MHDYNTCTVLQASFVNGFGGQYRFRIIAKTVVFCPTTKVKFLNCLSASVSHPSIRGIGSMVIVEKIQRSINNCFNRLLKSYA